MVRAEAEQSRSTEAEIEKGWETIGTYAKNEPTALRDALASLRMRCEASARSKDEAAAFVAAEKADSGGKSVRDALNDALNDEPRRVSMDDRRPERALLARVDESRIETEGTVTYSF